MKLTQIFALFMMLALISFLGFAVENIWLACTKGYMDNRNMTLPFLLGYGIAVLLIYLVFGVPDDMRIGNVSMEYGNKRISLLLYFLAVMISISFGEIILGTIVEKTCHFYWWDYSVLPLHITRYTSVPTSIGFTMIIVTFMDKVFIPVYKWFASWSISALGIAATFIMAGMIVDYLYSMYYMITHKSLYERWRVNMEHNPVYRHLNKDRNEMKRHAL